MYDIASDPRHTFNFRRFTIGPGTTHPTNSILLCGQVVSFGLAVIVCSKTLFFLCVRFWNKKHDLIWPGSLKQARQRTHDGPRNIVALALHLTWVLMKRISASCDIAIYRATVHSRSLVPKPSNSIRLSTKYVVPTCAPTTSHSTTALVGTFSINERQIQPATAFHTNEIPSSHKCEL